MKKITFLLILIPGLFMTHAQADISTGNYFGVEWAKLDSTLRIPDASQISGTRNETPTLDSFVFRIGRYFTDYMAAEIHLGTSLTEENAAGTKEAKMNNLFSLFFRGNYPLHNQNTNLYFLVGGSYTELDLKAPPSTVNPVGVTNITASGFSYAFGVELYATQKSAINIEYVRYITGDEVDLGGFSLGYIRHF